MRRLLLALPLLAACTEGQPLTVSVGDRLIYDSAARAAAAAPAPGDPAAPAPAGGGLFGGLTVTSNLPVFIGGRQVGGPGMPAP